MQSFQDQMILRVRCGRSYSFTSSHATNHFALAVYIFFTLGGYLRLFRWPILAWAAIVSFAQIYVGVHFPLDIIFGAFLGILIGWITSQLHGHWQAILLSRKGEVV